MAKPNLTAYVLTSVLVALSHTRRWKQLVPSEAVVIYRACLKQCAQKDIFYKILQYIPGALKLSFMDKLIVRGYAKHIALRKQEIERQARLEISAGCRQIVVMGAGFDALAWRLSQEKNDMQYFELDMPETQEIKRSALQAAHIAVPSNLFFIPCDFSKVQLDKILLQQPHFKQNVHTLFIAEGLTMYLTEAENEAWLKAAYRLAGENTRVIFTAIEKLDTGETVGEVVRDGVLKRRGERFRWAIHMNDMAAFLTRSGFLLGRATRYADLQKPYCNQQDYARLTRQNGEHIFYASAGA